MASTNLILSLIGVRPPSSDLIGFALRVARCCRDYCRYENATEACRAEVRFFLLGRTDENESLGAPYWLCSRDGYDREFSVCLGFVREADDGRDALEVVRRAMGLYPVYRF